MIEDMKPVVKGFERGFLAIPDERMNPFYKR